MTVTTKGPEGYRFQDLASVELALRLIEKDNLQMYIESSEDLVIVFNENGYQKTIEIQVKQTSKDISLSFLADILAHFTAYKSDDFFIKRIADNDDSYALLIAGGRCLDATRPYLRSEGLGWPHKPDFITQTNVEELIGKLKQVKDKAETFRDARGIAVQKFLEFQTKKSFRPNLQKVAIEELVTEDSLIKACKAHLFKLYRIPSDTADNVIAELREEVVKSKREALADFIPILNSTIRKYFRRTKNQNYITRADEGQWQDSIAKNKALLLSGPPKCGKTYAAEHFSAAYEEMGYEVEKGTSVGAAERFLSMSVSNPRAYILEDPLGAISKTSNASETLSKLLGVIETLENDRKLIVTQRQDILLEVMAVEDLSDCSLNGIDWFNLDTSDISFLTKAWIEFCSESNVKSEVKTYVSEMLASGIKIEVGSLRHLASTADKISDNPTQTEILKAARQDANYIASEFSKTMEAASLLSTFAFTTGAAVPLGEKELKFILSPHEYSCLPGYIERDGLGYSYFPSEVADEPVPTYPSELKFSPEIQNHLDNLEQRRFVENTGDGFNFSHPFYRAVGQAAAKLNTTRKKELFLKNLRRAVYSLSADTSSTMISSFDWIIEHNKKNIEIIEAIVEIAIEAFSHTLFVRTQQNCYRFLLSNSKFLSERQSAEMSILSQRISRISGTDIRWLNSEAVFYWGSSQDGFAHLARRKGAEIDEADVRPIVDRNYSKEQAFNFALGVSRRPELLKFNDVLTLLNYEESIIRAQAAKSWLCVPRDNDQKILQKIFSDDQPNVFIRALQSIIECSELISAERISILTDNLKKSLASPFISSATLSRLDLFSSDEFYEDTEHENRWRIFSAVASVSLRTVPDGVGLASSIFADCMTKTLRSKISLEEKLETLDGWLSWIERKAELKIPLDDWISRALEDVLEFIPPHVVQRLNVLKRYANIPGTGYKVVFVQEMLRYWETLTKEEKHLVFLLLSEKSSDLKWKLATAVISANKETLSELREIAKENGEPFSLDVEKKSEISNLIVILICKLAPTPAYIGVSAERKQSWVKQLQEMARDPENRFFKQAFVNLRVNHIDSFNEIVLQSYEKNPTLVLDHLWRIEAELQGLWNSAAWKVIYDFADDEEKIAIVETIAKNMHSFIEKTLELELCFGKDLGEDVFAKTSDLTVFREMFDQKFTQFGDSDEEQIRDKYRGQFEALVEKDILFPWTYSRINVEIQKLKYPWRDFMAKLEDLHLKSYGIAHESRQRNSLQTQISLADEEKLGWQR